MNREALLCTLEQKVAPAHAALIAVDVRNDGLEDDRAFHDPGFANGPVLSSSQIIEAWRRLEPQRAISGKSKPTSQESTAS